MNTIEFIKKVKNEGKALTVYHLSKILWEAGNDTASAISEEYLDGFYFDREDAVKAMEDVAKSTEPEFGVRTEICLDKAEISPDDLDGVDFDEVEEFGGMVFGDSDLLEIFNEHRDYEDSSDVEFQYEIPKYLVAENRVYYVMTDVMGVCELEDDIDKEADTLSVSTHDVGATMILYRDGKEEERQVKSESGIKTQYLILLAIFALGLVWWTLERRHGRG